MKYERKEMIYDCIKFKDVIIFDVNTNLIMDLDIVSKRIKLEFPEVLRILKIKAIATSISPGEAIVIKLKGFTFVALVTRVRLFGEDTDGDEEINLFTMNAIENMLTKLDKQSNFVSGILNRSTNTWKNLALFIAQKRLNWSIYTE